MSKKLPDTIINTMFNINIYLKYYLKHPSKVVEYLNTLGFKYVDMRRLAFSDDADSKYYEVQKFYNKNYPFRDYALFLVTKLDMSSFKNIQIQSFAIFRVIYESELDIQYSKAVLSFEDVLSSTSLKNPNCINRDTIEIMQVSKDDISLDKLDEFNDDNATRFTYKGKTYFGKLILENLKATVFIENVDTHKRFHIHNDDNFKNLMVVYNHDKALFFKQCMTIVKNI